MIPELSSNWNVRETIAETGWLGEEEEGGQTPLEISKGIREFIPESNMSDH